MKRRAGPNPNRSVATRLPPSSIGLALISTLFSIKNASKPGSTKEAGSREVAHRFGCTVGARRAVTLSTLAAVDAALFPRRLGLPPMAIFARRWVDTRA